MGRRIKCDAASLRLHDAFDQMQTESISRNIRPDSFTAIEGFEQVTLINRVDSRTVVRNAELDLVGARIFFRGDFTLRFVAGLAVLQGVAQQVLHALR